MPAYMPWEPGLNAAPSLEAFPLIARRVARVPNPSDIANDTTLFERPELPNLIASLDHAPANPQTKVAILRDDRYLFIAFDCVEPNFAGLHRLVPATAPNGEMKMPDWPLPRHVETDDHVSIRIDALHSHVRTHWFQLNVNGARRYTNIETYMSWSTIPAYTETTPAAPNWETHVQELPDRWRAAFKIDLAFLAIHKQPTIGLFLSRARYAECLRRFVSAPTLPDQFASPVAMNDLYLNDTGVTVRRIAWPNRTQGDNRVTLTVHNAKAPRGVRLLARVQSSISNAGTESSTVALPTGQATEIPIAYHLPHNLDVAALQVEVQDAATQESLYQSSFPLGIHTQLNAPRRSRNEGASNPAPSDPNFHDRKIQYIFSRLQKFERRNTAQGAPSDFTLVSADGKVTFNLMQPGTLLKIGQYLDSLFDNPIDRLVAAALFSNDDVVSAHCAARVSMQQNMTPLSTIRLGSGHCAARAMAGAGIVSAMTNPKTGNRFEAYPCLICGHVIVAIRWRDSFTFIDPSFGSFFFTADNTDLATDKELAANPDLISRVTAHKSALATYGRLEIHVRLEHGTLVWPAGAPAE